MKQIEPERGKFDFSLNDVAVEFSLRNNMKITGLHLVYGNDQLLPEWLLDGDYSREEYQKILDEYIFTLADHYKGKIYIWSIANEVASNMLWGGSDFWYKKLGLGYIESSFRLAKETDPNALLMLNDPDNHSFQFPNNKRVVNYMLESIRKWKDDGIPIDVVGMQMHLLYPWSNSVVPTKEDMENTIQLFSNEDLPVYITEFDVNLNDYPGSETEKLAYQADVYKNSIETCLRSKGCGGFSIFGLSDAWTWYNELNISGAKPLIFDTELNPKPAYFSLIKAFENIGQ